MQAAVQTDFVDNKKLQKLHKREQIEDRLKKERMKRMQFLREQILLYDRIDLLMVEVLGYEIQDFHLLMWYHRRNNGLKIGKQNWHLALAPRGTGKSTILTVSSIILDILKNPNIRILIASKTDENAVAFLSEVKQKLQLPKLVEIFGPQKGELWNEGEIKVGPRTSTAKEPTVKTVGVNGALASAHFDKIYADDLVDEENSKTDAQRAKITTWMWKILDPTLEPHGEMSIIGTRYHPEDLYGVLIETVLTVKKKVKTKLGKVKRKTVRHYIRIPALIKKAKCKESAPAHKRYISIWPEKFPVKFLLKKRRTQGTIIFNCLTAKTRVLSKRGYIPARKVRVGDELWTGQWQKVSAIKVGEHHDNIYCLRTWYNPSLTKLTAEHRVLVNGEFIPASNVQPGNYVQFPINSESDLSAIPVEYRNPEVFKLIGHWLANGSCYGDSGCNRWKTVISLGTHRQREIAEVCQLVEKHLVRQNRMGRPCENGETSSVTVVENGSATNLIFSNKMFWEFLQQFGKHAHGKYLPHWVQDLPKEYILELFRGYYIGDGFVLSRSKELGVNSVSRNMLEGFQQALLKLGIISRVQKVADATQRRIDSSNKLRNCRALFGLFIRNAYAHQIDAKIPVLPKKHKYSDKGFISDGRFYVKVREVLVKKYAGKTYDFEVEEDHVFTSGLITLHNSQMQNDVEAMKGKIFKPDWFLTYRLEDINIHELKIFQGVDLAIKQKETADKFAHCTIGVHPKTLNIYVLDYYNRVTHYNLQKKVIGEKFNKFDPIRVGVEANGYQSALLQDMRSNKHLAHVRAVPVFTETDKTIRAWKLSAYFERGQVYMLEWMHELQEILLKMPDGRYKDLFDALDIAVEMAFNRKKKVRESEPGLIK